MEKQNADEWVQQANFLFTICIIALLRVLDINPGSAMNHSNSHRPIMSRAFLKLIVFLIVNPCIMLCQCFMNHILIPREQWTVVRLNHKRQRYSNQQKLYYRNEQGDKREDSLSLSSEIEVFDARSIRTENTEDKDDDVIAGVNMNSTHSTRKNEIDAIEKIGNIGGDIGSSIVCEKRLDYVGAGTLGDIMSDPSEDDVNVKLNAGGVDTADAVCDELVCDDDNIIEEETRNQCMSVADVKSKKEMGLDDLGTHSNSISGPTKSGLVTSTGGTLTAQYGLKIPDMSPLDRIALTANGNLQRIFSSFYDAPVHVHVDKCVRREGSYNLDDSKRNEAIWDREVNISIFDEVSADFCDFCIS